MKIKEAIDQMSSMYLERVIKSFTGGEYPKKQDEEDYRKEIRDNLDALADVQKIRDKFDMMYMKNGNPYSEKLLASFILKSILTGDSYCSNENEIVRNIQQEENTIIANSANPESFKHLHKNAIDIFEAVLDVALEDDDISIDEMALLNKLRNKLKINEKDQYLIQAKLKQFPSKDNNIHSLKEVRTVLNELQKSGIVLFCNQPNDSKEPFYTIPEELIPGVKSVLDIELVDNKYNFLLNRLNTAQISQILEFFNVHKYGTKDDVINRVIRVGIKPSEALNVLSVEELWEYCEKLPGLKKSGKKADKIREIIEYFDNLITKVVEENSDKRRFFYNYYEQLAKRDEKNLMISEVIKKGKDIDNAFEEATRYIFEEKFKLELLDQENSDHCDGCLQFKHKDDLFMWDNKSKMEENEYYFPEQHVKQFKRYIRDANNKGKRVNCFLVITNKISEDAERNAYRLKSESGVDTDVALITAEDLKFVADIWHKEAKKDKFNLEVFNVTGILTREILKKRMKWNL